MSLVFYITLLTSLLAFALIKRIWMAALVGYGVAIALTAGLLAMHGEASMGEIVEAIRPSLADGIVGGVVAFVLVRSVQRMRKRNPG